MSSHLVMQNIEALSSPERHYSHVVTANNMSFISGLLPLDKNGVPLTDKPIEFQINQVLENLNACLIGIKAQKPILPKLRCILQTLTNGLLPMSYMQNGLVSINRPD